MRSHRLPLFSVDTHRPAGDFDLLAFNVSAELVYTNVLNCIDLASVPVRAADRGPEHPLVVAGGHCAFNPEPLADFVDVFVIGDGEEVVSEITEVVGEWKAHTGNMPKNELMRFKAATDDYWLGGCADTTLRSWSVSSSATAFATLQRAPTARCWCAGAWTAPSS